MTAVLITLLTLFVALVGPNGTTVYVAPSQVVAIVDSHGVGACPTTLTTVNQPVFVCESASEVKHKLEATDFLIASDMRADDQARRIAANVARLPELLRQ